MVANEQTDTESLTDTQSNKMNDKAKKRKNKENTIQFTCVEVLLSPLITKLVEQLEHDNEHVSISHDFVQCTPTSNNLNNAPEHFSVHVASPRLTTGHVKHSEAYK